MYIYDENMPFVYVIKDAFASQYKYRTVQLDYLRNKYTEAERLDHIDRQINNLSSITRVGYYFVI